MQLDLVTLIVEDYDSAIDFFTNKLRFTLAEDKPAFTSDGRAKRWVVVRPPTGGTGLVLARADGEHQSATVGNQYAGRVGFFLAVADFDEHYQHMLRHGIIFDSEPRTESYGTVAVFLDIAGNRWDLIGPS